MMEGNGVRGPGVDEQDRDVPRVDDCVTGRPVH